MRSTIEVVAQTNINAGDLVCLLKPPGIDNQYQVNTIYEDFEKMKNNNTPEVFKEVEQRHGTRHTNVLRRLINKLL